MRQQEYVAANEAKPSAQNKQDKARREPELNRVEDSETGGRADRERKHRLIHIAGSSVIRHK